MKIFNLPLDPMIVAIVLHLLLLSSLPVCEARSRSKASSRHQNLPRLSNDSSRKRAVNGSACIEALPGKVTAPKTNVWKQLSFDEYKDVREFLHRQKDLNLTGPANITGFSNSIYGGSIELMIPNKTDVIPYLDTNGRVPARYAKATINIRTKGSSTLNQILIGPLPVNNITTTWQPLGYPYTRKSGSIRDIYFGVSGVLDWVYKLAKEIKNITAHLWPGLNGSEVGCCGSSVPLLQSPDGSVASWGASYSVGGIGIFDTYTLLPLNLYAGVQWEYGDKSNSTWKFLGWLYHDVLYSTTAAFKNAFSRGQLKTSLPAISGPWANPGHRGEILPDDTKPPPQAVAPAGARFSIDKAERYVEWMGFSFYMGYTVNRGWAFYDIRHKGNRILYELSLQEALAHYAGTDPEQSTTSYLDSTYDLGADTVELVRGYDCPDYATYLPTSFDPAVAEQAKDTVCMFEFDADYPMARHSSNTVSNTKNIFFVVRSVYTVGNYDYLFSYEFYLDGSIKVQVRASGYIQGQYYQGNEEYGYRIHEALSGSMHDHVLNFKADFDILGTANTMQLATFVPANEKYIWWDKPRQTFKLQQEFIESEDDSRLIWDRATQYRIVNTDKPNKYGEYRGYRILPVDGTTHFTNNQSSNLENLVYPFTFDIGVTKQKDTEPRSTDILDENDIHNPMVNFDTFFDGESLKQEDLVVWFNLGMHHLPHTGDLPHTVFTTAHAGVQIMPSNYYLDDISTESVSQVLIEFASRGENVTKVKTFGQQEAVCSVDLAKEQPDFYNFEEYFF